MLCNSNFEEKDEIYSFLMAGQSNMAGRGEFADVPQIRNRLCYMLRMGRWQNMREPVNIDRDIFDSKYHSGISLGASFANEFSLYTGRMSGLIPCADGGTAIDEWAEGGILFEHAVFMTELAKRSSTFAGIIWHHGENDCVSDELLYAYKDKFINTITKLRCRVGCENLPLIIGELPRNPSAEWGLSDRTLKMNKILAEVAGELEMCRLVSSDGLTLKLDGIHFDSPSLRILGKRYFEAYRELEKI